MRPLLFASLCLLACRQRFDVCEDVTADSLGALPAHLSETGLFVDANETLGPNVVAYTPSFPLWSDGAEKRRWLSLPAGTLIDTSDPDNWRFPAGTTFWKEFTRDGVRIETRVLRKTGEAEDAWVGAAYVWTGSDAELSREGAVDARGTPHDVPSATRCVGCHGGRKSRVLGFTAVQLDNGATPGLAQFASLMSVPPQQSFRIPGNDVEREALGYLYANCSHCHNQNRPDAASRCYAPMNEIDFSLAADTLTGDVTKTATYVAVVGRHIRAGQPDQSRIVEMMRLRAGPNLFGPSQMPPLATDVVDEKELGLIREWISQMK